MNSIYQLHRILELIGIDNFVNETVAIMSTNDYNYLIETIMNDFDIETLEE